MRLQGVGGGSGGGGGGGTGTGHEGQAGSSNSELLPRPALPGASQPPQVQQHPHQPHNGVHNADCASSTRDAAVVAASVPSLTDHLQVRVHVGEAGGRPAELSYVSYEGSLCEPYPAVTLIPGGELTSGSA
eukprot:1161965-Pelagomonas_calceolata.AAC.1